MKWICSNCGKIVIRGNHFPDIVFCSKECRLAFLNYHKVLWVESDVIPTKYQSMADEWIGKKFSKKEMEALTCKHGSFTCGLLQKLGTGMCNKCKDDKNETKPKKTKDRKGKGNQHYQKLG